MRDELGAFVYKFLENKEIRFLGNQKNEWNALFEFLKAGILSHDHPDGFCKYGDNVLIIEHFEFDSSYKDRKGSTNRQEIFRTSNYKPQNSEGFEIYRDKIKCNYTIENYFDNLIENFSNHYDKIKDYKEDLKKEKVITDNTNIKTLFCIEDTTALGNMNSHTGEPLIPLMCKEFITFLKTCSQLDYVITGSSLGQKNYTWFSSIPNVGYYLEHSYSKITTEIADFNPQTIMGVGYIPTK